MPEAKPMKSIPDHYPSKPPKKAQGMPQYRRRGGRHRVKEGEAVGDEYPYDYWSYQQLMSECKERGLYVKDDKKGIMARKLVDDDKEKRQIELKARSERKRKQREAEQAKKQAEKNKREEDEARRRRNDEKRRRRAGGDEVSDDERSEDEMEVYLKKLTGYDSDDRGHVGHALSDTSWDSTSTESTVASASEPIVHDCKLRIFEWSYPDLPALEPTYIQRQKYRYAEHRPRHIPYTSLKVITTKSRRSITLPGLTYPPEVDQDYVPVLSQRTKDAARNGILNGVLSNARIDRASDWADRTHVQGWNALMFFTLPPRNPKKQLDAVYRTWSTENRKLRRVKTAGEATKADREMRRVQRRKNKGVKVFQVYEASQHRPTAVCYLPAYLDHNSSSRDSADDGFCHERTLENLFFVRFEKTDTPHYYFWTRAGEWQDPTVPNPEWSRTQGVHEQKHSTEDQVHALHAARKRPVGTSGGTRKTLVRVKKVDLQCPEPVDTTRPSFETLLTGVEYELCNNGLQATLYKFKKCWPPHTWTVFGRVLPSLYPSGRLPDAPPVHADTTISIAHKIAMADASQGGDQVDLIRGDEPWTRDDDAFWDLVELEEAVGTDDEE